MKRTPLNRKTPMKRSSKEMKRTPLTNKTPMNRGDGLKRKESKRNKTPKRKTEKENLQKLEREQKLEASPNCEFCGNEATETHRTNVDGVLDLIACCVDCFRERYGVAGSRSPQQQEYYQEQRQIAFERSGGRCEADGFHHESCTGVANITHHIQPRPEGPDHNSNLITLYNGETPLGAGGCHQKIHTERGSSTRPGEAVELGFITQYEQ